MHNWRRRSRPAIVYESPSLEAARAWMPADSSAFWKPWDCIERKPRTKLTAAPRGSENEHWLIPQRIPGTAMRSIGSGGNHHGAEIQDSP